MKNSLRQLSALLLVSALAGVALLVGLDMMNHLRLTPGHQRAGAWSFMLIGISYIILQLSAGPGRGQIKGLLLGLGFLFWGVEQFLPPGPLATLLDSLVVLIFVSDLAWIIAGRLRRGSNRRP
jgi:hypothetical protein